MNFIAGLLLTYMIEEYAFYTFYTLMMVSTSHISFHPSIIDH